MTKRWRVMVIGSVDAGKSTLLNLLSENKVRTSKTESVDFCGEYVDTPGEFLDIPMHYSALISTSCKASLVLLMIDPTRICSIPPSFANVLSSPVVGVISKIDMADSEQKSKAEKSLKRSGVTEVCEISSVTGEGIDKLREIIERYRIA